MMNAVSFRKPPALLASPHAAIAPGSAIGGRRGVRDYLPSGSHSVRTRNGGLSVPIYDRIDRPDGTHYWRNSVDGSITGTLDRRTFRPDGSYFIREDDGGVTVPLPPPGPKPAPIPYDGKHVPDALAGRVNEMARIFTEETGRRLHVNSGYRTPARQAAAMYEKFRLGSRGEEYRNQSALKEVLGAFVQGRTEGLPQAEVEARMAKMLADQVSKGVYLSNHMRSGAVDIRTSKMSPAHIAALRRAGAKVGARLVVEGRPPHANFEFPTEQPAKR